MHIPLTTPSIALVARARRRATVAVAALACAALAALLSACGSSSSTTSTTAVKTNLNIPRIVRSIEANILAQRHLHSTVVCPTVVPQEAGKTFECIATTRATTKPFTVLKTPFVVTIQNDKGYVTYVGK